MCAHLILIQLQPRMDIVYVRVLLRDRKLLLQSMYSMCEASAVKASSKVRLPPLSDGMRRSQASSRCTALQLPRQPDARRNIDTCVGTLGQQRTRRPSKVLVNVAKLVKPRTWYICTQDTQRSTHSSCH